MRLVFLDAAAGLLLLGVIAAASTREKRRNASERRRRLGWSLVAIPLPLAVGLHMVGGLSQVADQSIFLLGVFAFAIGAALILTTDGDDDFHRENSDDSPPWWPEFEREFQEYARRSPSHRGKLIRT
jgi:hypothetical protein